MYRYNTMFAGTLTTTTFSKYGEQEGHIYVNFLGFHPYKEIIFSCIEDCYAVASHLNSTKVQYLGTVHLAGTYNRGIRESFAYAPCLIGDY
jgi:hypothetical protein